MKAGIEQLSASGRPLRVVEFILSWLLSQIEKLFPLVPTLGPDNVKNWQKPSVYYFLDDKSPQLGHRLRALLTLDRKVVSFWRKREEILNLVQRVEYHTVELEKITPLVEKYFPW